MKIFYRSIERKVGGVKLRNRNPMIQFSVQLDIKIKKGQQEYHRD